jgi:NADH-quinone oxidoreductase subunit H
VNVTAATFSIWRNTFGLPEGAPQWLIVTVALLCTFCLVVLPSGAILSFVDRKLSADLQARVGPNRAGPRGIFQPIADLFKLLQKSADAPWSWREILWLSVHTMALYSTLAVLPLGSLALLVDSDMSAFLPFLAALVLALGNVLLGITQDSVAGWFGGVRVAAQALAGTFPALAALLAAGVRAGGFRWSLFAESQSASPLHWAVANPFQLLAFLVFVASGMVMLGVAPLDPALSISDLNGGVSSQLSGRRLNLFRLGRFYGFFFWSVISVVLFLGAWRLPSAVMAALQDAAAFSAIQVLELLLLLAKAFALMLVLIWVARSNPRSRVDQVTDFAWKVLGPFSLLALAGAAVWRGWGVWF